MRSTEYGVHEITDMRELINFKVACLTEAKSRLGKVENLELKKLVELNISQGRQTVSHMKGILSTASKQLQ